MDGRGHDLRNMKKVKFGTGFHDILKEQFKNHKKISPVDIYKLLYQGVYGAKHAVAGFGHARKMLENEFLSMDILKKKPTLPSIEVISEKYCRVNLWPYFFGYEKTKDPIEEVYDLARAFAVGARANSGNKELLMNAFVNFAHSNKVHKWFSIKQINSLYKMCQKREIVHHSKEYHDLLYPETLVKPHYRVIPIKMLYFKCAENVPCSEIILVHSLAEDIKYELPDLLKKAKENRGE